MKKIISILAIIIISLNVTAQDRNFLTKNGIILPMKIYDSAAIKALIDTKLSTATAAATYQPIGSYLTSYTETDPIVRAINGIITSNGTTFSAATQTSITSLLGAGSISNTMLANTAVALLSGTNSGDNAVNTLYSGLVSNATHTGEVTGATALTITAAAVTNAKLANMATNTIKGVSTAGVPTDLTATQAKVVLAIANTDVSGLGTLATQSGTFSGSSSGTNTGDNATNTTSNTYADGKVQNSLVASTTLAPSVTAVNTGLATKENTITAGTTAQYYRGDKTFQTLDKAAVGLANVDNTSDANKPVSTATQTALNLKANLASPTFTGTVGLPAGQVVNGVTLSTGAGATTYLNGSGTYTTPAGGSGEVNTASNTGTVGVGLFKQKTALDLEFYKINPLNNKVTVALNGTDRVDIGVAEANFSGIPLTTAVTGVLPIANGGTGSATQNFIDLTTSQTKNVGVTANTTPLLLTGSINDFLQYDIKNTSTGTAAQSGYSASANDGTPTTKFMWMGKNNTGYNNPQTYNVGVANDGSLLNDGGNLWIHNTGTTGKIAFSTGNASTPFYTERMAVNSDGSIAFNGSVGTANQVLQSNGAAPPTWVALAGGGNAIIANGLQQFTGTNDATFSDLANTPSLPAAGLSKIYVKDIGGRAIFTTIDEWGETNHMQSSLTFNNFSGVGPGATTIPTVIGRTCTFLTTVSHPVIATTNYKTSINRYTQTSAATAGGITGTRVAVNECLRGNAANIGGFYFVGRISLTTLQAGNRAFCGLSTLGSTAPTNIDPTTSTTAGVIGLAINANTGNWNLVHNAAGTAPTIIALGANYPVNITDFIELILYTPANKTTVYYRVRNLATSLDVSGILSTNLPLNTSPMGRTCWMTNNATAAAVALDISKFSLETPN